MCCVTQSCPTLCYPIDWNLPAPLSMGFFRKEYWSVLPFPPPGDLPNPGIKPKFPVSFAFTNVFLTYLATWEVHRRINNKYFFFKRQKKPKKKPDIYCLTFSNFQNLSAKYLAILGIQFSTVQSLSRVWLFATPWTAACQSSLSITNSHSLPKFMLIESVMPSSHLIFCCPLLLPPSVFPSIRVFSNESAVSIRWPKYWSFSFSISPSNEYSGLTSFRINLLNLLEVQGTLKSLLQHHSSKASILEGPAFFIVQLSHPYVTPGKTIALTIWQSDTVIVSAF